MTYEMAQNKIDDQEDNEAVTKGLRRLLDLSRILKRRRTEKGALVLASSEVRFNIDSETADPIDVQVKMMSRADALGQILVVVQLISVLAYESAEQQPKYVPKCQF